MDKDVLEDLSDDVLLQLLRPNLSRSAFLEVLIGEASGRSDVTSNELDSLLKRFVESALDELLARYRELDEAITWGGDPADVENEFARYVDVWQGKLGAKTPTEPDWPWPISEPPDRPPGDGDPFPHPPSGLWRCGYRVGKTNGMPDGERRAFLTRFFRNKLPSVVEKYHGREYGDPGSEIRLRKIANVIAAHCRNFKKNDREKYRFAIADWEEDLAYLKKEYYRAGTFPWPPIEP